MAKIKSLENSDSINEVTARDRVNAGIQYLSSLLDPFSSSGPTDSYSWILAEIVRERQKPQSSYQNGIRR